MPQEDLSFGLHNDSLSEVFIPAFFFLKAPLSLSRVREVELELASLFLA
jgi:hypothetical protein